MQIEHWSAKNKNTKDVFILYLFNNKKVMKRALGINEIKKSVKTICKCKLVVFEVEGKNKKGLLDTLSDIGKMQNYYGLVAEVGESKLYYFPQLNYSDAYLIKNILKEKYVGTNINVTLGQNAI